MPSVKKADGQAKHQVAMVFDLNKCLGCQTCTIACKRLWTRDEGMEHLWWATVNTQPGLGTPRDWENMGGGFLDDVIPSATCSCATRERTGRSPLRRPRRATAWHARAPDPCCIA